MNNGEYLKKVYDLKSWQGHHVSQLAYTRNLVLVLSTGSLGFAITLLQGESLRYCSIVALKIASLFLLLSIIIGVAIAWLESENYRLKYKIGRRLAKEEGELKELPEVANRDDGSCTRLECINRQLLRAQLTLFSVAIAIMTVLFLVL